MYDGDKIEEAHIPDARLAHARRAPTRAGLCGVGTRNRPQSLGSRRLALNVNFESFVAPLFEMYKHLGHAEGLLDASFSTLVALPWLQWLIDAASRVFERLQGKSAVPKKTQN